MLTGDGEVQAEQTSGPHAYRVWFDFLLDGRRLKQPNAERPFASLFRETPAGRRGCLRQFLSGGHPEVHPFFHDVLVAHPDPGEAGGKAAVAVPLMVLQVGGVFRVERIDGRYEELTTRCDCCPERFQESGKRLRSLMSAECVAHDDDGLKGRGSEVQVAKVHNAHVTTPSSAAYPHGNW